jgi:tetratricopeptide (TPR) repeat protein
VDEDYPESPQARTARGGIAAWKAVLELAALPPPAPALDDGWQPFRAYGTKPDQGLSYAEDLYQNGNLVYALQEYAKVLCDIYIPTGKPNPHRAYARYRIGVCAYRLRHPDAAARQWRRLIEDEPGTPWAARATRALALVNLTDPFSSDAGRPAPALPSDLPTPPIQRFHLAGQLLDCELPDVAMKEYLKVLYVLTAGKPNPYQAEASYRLGLCQAHLGRPGLALAAWNHTVEDYPETEWAKTAENAIGQTKQRESALAEGLDAARE